MRQKKLSAGVVGTGFIGPVHIEVLRRIGVEVIGIVSSSKRGEKVAEELGVPQVYDSVEKLVQNSQLDVVHITTPNYLHASQVLTAFRAGKKVLCEKPLTLTTEESRNLMAYEREHHCIGCVCYNLRYYPMVQMARELIKSGELGEILLVHGSYLQDWLLFPTDWNWRIEAEMGGKLRAVGDIGTHWMDMMQYVTGLKIQEVFADRFIAYPKRYKPQRGVSAFQASADKQKEETEVSTEDYAGILLRFSNGGRGSLNVSQISAGRKNRLWFEIDGTKSSVSWDSEHPNELWIGKRSEANRILLKDPSLLPESIRWTSSYPGGHQEGYADTFKNLFLDFYSHISMIGETTQKGPVTQAVPGAPTYPTLEDGHIEMLILDAIRESIEESRWVKVQSYP